MQENIEYFTGECRMDLKNVDLTSFRKGLSDLNLTLTIEQEKQFLLYYEMMIEKNKVMNLTAITEFEDVIEKHFLDSLSLASFVNLDHQSVIDIGTGAGFPGIPLKIAFPDLHITLMDSLNKRILFLQDVIEALHLEGISAVHARAEDLGHKAEYREQFDLCVSRAVANLSTLCEYSLPFVKVGGMFVSYKSGEIEAEAKEAEKAIKLLGGERKETIHFQLNHTEIARSFVLVEKKKQTPKTYPRKAGTPSKSPLA